MLIVQSHNGVPVRLTGERWMHIISRHPEMATQKDRVFETIFEPDMIQQGDFDELLAVRLFAQTPLTQKHLVVAYRENSIDDGFIVTAYLTRRPSTKRKVLWRR
jgi:hypothetical protein